MSAGPIISDHALLRFLERAGGLDVETIRLMLSRSLERAKKAATGIGGDATDNSAPFAGAVYVY